MARQIMIRIKCKRSFHCFSFLLEVVVSSYAVVSNIVVVGLVMGLVVASVVNDSLDSETILTNITELSK